VAPANTRSDQPTHITTRAILQALVACTALVLNACARPEPGDVTSPDPTLPPLELVTVYSTSVTEPSGLAYSRASGNLYMVSDNRPEIFRIDTTGKVLGSIPITATDLEGITVTANADTFIVVEETASMVSTFLPNGTKVSSFPINVWTDPKHKLEGITRTPEGHLMVLNEKVPMMMLEFSGTTELWRRTLSYTTDISDICYDADTDSYWVVSDESQKVLNLSRSGDLLGEWSTPVNQGEGIAIIGRRLYIVSDTEAKFYVFVKPQ
jgi:uncharacterized protein YjiK